MITRAALRVRRTPSSLLPLMILPSLALLLLAVSIPVDHLLGRHGGDLQLYFDRSRSLLAGQVPYRDFPLEYPPLSLIAFALPRLIAPDPSLSLQHYVILFVVENALLVLVCAVGIRTLIAELRPRPSAAFALGMFGLMVIAAAPIIAWRFDLFPATLTLLAVGASLLGGPVTAGILMALAILTKLYPMALVPVIGVAYLANRDTRGLRGFLTAIAITLGVVTALAMLADPVAAWGFLDYYWLRGIQVESLPAGLIGLARLLGWTTASVSYEFSSWQVNSPLSDPLLRLQLPTIAAAYSAVVVMGYARFRREVVASGEISARTFIAYTLAALLVFVGLGKVFSPQYIAWLIPFAPMLASGPMLAVLLVCLLTVTIYPLVYADALVGLELWAIVAVNLRNMLVIGLAAWLVWRYRPTPDVAGLPRGAPRITGGTRAMAPAGVDGGAEREESAT